MHLLSIKLYQIIKYKDFTTLDHIVLHSLLVSKGSLLKYSWESHSPWRSVKLHIDGSLEIFLYNCQEAYNEGEFRTYSKWAVHIIVSEVNLKGSTCKLHEVKFVFLFCSLDNWKVRRRTPGRCALQVRARCQSAECMHRRTWPVHSGFYHCSSWVRKSKSLLPSPRPSFCGVFVALSSPVGRYKWWHEDKSPQFSYQTYLDLFPALLLNCCRLRKSYVKFFELL